MKITRCAQVAGGIHTAAAPGLVGTSTLFSQTEALPAKTPVLRGRCLKWNSQHTDRQEWNHKTQLSGGILPSLLNQLDGRSVAVLKGYRFTEQNHLKTRLRDV